MTTLDYEAGEIIFREGEDGSSTFVIVQGAVELTRQGETGPIRLAVLGPGEPLGDVDDLGRRGATARAVEPVTLEAVGQESPPPKSSTFDRLIEMLSGDGAAKETPEPVPGQAAVEAPAGFLTRFFGGVPHAKRIDILVANLMDEAGENHARHIAGALKGPRGIRARPFNKTMPPEVRRPEERARLARGWLEAADADLLIWGEIPPPGTTLDLHFVSSKADEEYRPGSFGPATTLNLPVGFGPELTPLLLPVSLAATRPRTDAKGLRLVEVLPQALDMAMPIARNLPLDMTSGERAAVQSCFANALVTAAAFRNDPDLYQMAAQTYQEALANLSLEETPEKWAFNQKNLGMVLLILAEGDNDTDTLDAAAEAFRAALKVLNKEEHPRHWAVAQNRLGMVLFKLDASIGDPELLKHALTAFQAALQVITKAEDPTAWAEIMGNFAQAAQVLGKQLRNPEVLEKAAEACRAALEVRDRDEMPMAWAATQNNLGSALFLLGKLTGESDHLLGAAQAFERARDTYTGLGAARLAAITEKNLAHVEPLLEARKKAPSLKRRKGRGT